jgi:arylformamidase
LKALAKRRVLEMTLSPLSSGRGDYLDLQFNPRLQVPGFAAHFTKWRDGASTARQQITGQLNLAYGSTKAETFDFFPASGANRPLLIFLHGGYWRGLDKSDFSWVATPFVAQGISVAIANYGLLPVVPLKEIVAQVRRCCVWLYEHARDLGLDRRRFVCSGHSAGGHLTAMMLTTDWPSLSARLPRRLLAGALTISALTDLIPLCEAPFLHKDLGLEPAQARELSPAYLECLNEVPIVRAVGALESQEFHAQSELLAKIWPASCQAPMINVPEANHMSVCDVLGTPDSCLSQAVHTLIASAVLADR